MRETESVPSSEANGIDVDVSGRFVPGSSETAVPAFADQVAQRAYFLYIDSAARHGHDLQHWLLAEQQIRAEASAAESHERTR